MLNELLQGLKNYIESLQDGGKINLIDFIEDEGFDVTDNLLAELYQGVRDMNIRSSKVINSVVVSILVYAR
jgi:RNase adaptor protein for sRNA GlmZ degradation